MDALSIARLQFGVTTVYHFFFVPLTLGLSIMVAIMETLYVQSGKEVYKRDDQVLGQAVCHQFCHGRGHRHCAGIPVWHELVGIFSLCRRYFWRAAGH